MANHELQPIPVYSPVGYHPLDSQKDSHPKVKPRKLAIGLVVRRGLLIGKLLSLYTRSPVVLCEVKLPDIRRRPGVG